METMAAFLGLGPMGGQDGSAKRCGEIWGQGLTAVRRIQSLDVHGDVGLRDVARFQESFTVRTGFEENETDISIGKVGWGWGPARLYQPWVRSPGL